MNHKCKQTSSKISSIAGVVCGEILQGFNDNNFLHCHAYEESFVILYVHDPPRYKCSQVSGRTRKKMVTFSDKK